MASFRAYPSIAQTFLAYDRRIPLACNVALWDTTGAFDFGNHCFVAPCDCVVDFHVQLLWAAPPDGWQFAALLIKNTLPTVIGDTGGEIAGDDICVHQPNPTTLYNQSSRLSAKLKLVAGDKVWAVPCSASGNATLCPAIGVNGNNIATYFEGVIIS